jgi:hypothetical protein
MNPAVARYVCEVSVAAVVGITQAHPRLLLPVERDRRGFGEAPVGAVDAVDRRASIPVQSEERADAIHGAQDNKRPAGGTGEADR